jgi:T-lymphoma invasion and metastasis-inducing protein 1
MTAEQYARIRAQDPRYRGKSTFYPNHHHKSLPNVDLNLGSSTLPRTTTRTTDNETSLRGDKVATATSSTSLYDNVASGNQSTASNAAENTSRQNKSDTSTMTSMGTQSVGTQNQLGQDDNVHGQPNQRNEESSKSEGTQAGGTLQQKLTKTASIGTGTRSKDHNEELVSEKQQIDFFYSSWHLPFQCREAHEMHHSLINGSKRNKSKSTEDMNIGKENILSIVAKKKINIHIVADTGTLKRMYKPMQSTESPVTSPEMGRRRYNYYNSATNTVHNHPLHSSHFINSNNTMPSRQQASRFSGSR